MHNKRRGNSLLGPECFHCITHHSVVINANNINELVEAYQFTSECDLTFLVSHALVLLWRQSAGQCKNLSSSLIVPLPILNLFCE